MIFWRQMYLVDEINSVEIGPVKTCYFLYFDYNSGVPGLFASNKDLEPILILMVASKLVM